MSGQRTVRTFLLSVACGLVLIAIAVASAPRGVLTVEHKYFDGLTDAHLQAVSFNGSGDCQATLKGTGHRIPPLSLVKDLEQALNKV